MRPATATPFDASQAAYRPGRAGGGWLALPVLMAGTFLIVLDFFVVNVTIPSLQSGLRAGTAAVEWVVAGYGLTFAVFLVSAGRLGDRVGRRHAFSIGLVLFVLASASCGLAPSASALVGARLAQGLGAALISANVLSMIGVLYTGPSRVRAITVYGMVMGVAASGGVLQRGEPYQVYGTNGHPVSADEAKAIIADQFTVPEDVRQRRRASKRLQGKAPQQVVARHAKPSAERAAARRPSPEPMVTERLTPIKDVVAAIATRTGVPS